MIPTPDLSHITQDDFLDVYEPAEDTFALLDALEQDAKRLQVLRPTICLEIGSGSGCVSAFLAKILGKNFACYFCTDINAKAAQLTRETGPRNGCTLDAVIGDLASPFEGRMTQSVDVLLFNPPYVPTSEQEYNATEEHVTIANSWAGGRDGMAVTDEVLRRVPDLLATNGHFYLVCVAENKPDKILADMFSRGLSGSCILKRRAGREHLSILRFSKIS